MAVKGIPAVFEVNLIVPAPKPTGWAVTPIPGSTLILFDRRVAIEDVLSTAAPFPKLPFWSKTVKLIVTPLIITPVISPSTAVPPIFILSTCAILKTPPVIAASGTVIAPSVFPAQVQEDARRWFHLKDAIF